jgi:hypothetical protein
MQHCPSGRHGKSAKSVGHFGGVSFCGTFAGLIGMARHSIAFEIRWNKANALLWHGPEGRSLDRPVTVRLKASTLLPQAGVEPAGRSD